MGEGDLHWEVESLKGEKKRNSTLKQNADTEIFQERTEGETMDIIADRIDLGSGRTYRKAKKVWDAHKEGNELATDLIDEETYAEMDLFDWLDIIDALRGDLTQEEIAEEIGWGRNKVAQHNAILNNVVTGVLEMAKAHQEDRVTDGVTNVTNFTEGWFRTIGIYDLDSERQYEVVSWFIGGISSIETFNSFKSIDESQYPTKKPR